MKITICSPDGKGYFGGPYEWVKRFGPSLQDAGLQVNFLFLSDHSQEESSTYNYLKELGFECSLLCVHSKSEFNDNTEFYINWLLTQTQKYKPDVFVANNLLPAMFAGRWIKESGIPVIGVLHSDDPRLLWVREEFIQGSKEFALSGLVCVSKFLKEKVEKNNPHHIPIQAISCGTPTLDNLPAKDATKLKLVYAGKLTNEAKQIIFLTKSFIRVVKEVENTEAYIYGNGDKKDEVLKLLESEAKGLPVYYGGWIPSNQIQSVLSDKDIIVLLSDYEGLPVILLEGMACGLVPVCLKISSGIPELVIHGETGLLVNNRNEDFINSIKLLKSNRVLFEKLSFNAKTFAINQHSMKTISNRWIEFMKELLHESNDRKEIEIPSKIALPPVNPLSNSDIRKKSFIKYLVAQLKRIKRKFLK